MLAPMAIVLLGYYYFSFAKMNSDLQESRKKEAGLIQQTKDIELDQMDMDRFLLNAKNSLKKAKKKTAAAEAELAAAKNEKSVLRSIVLGKVNASASPTARQAASNSGFDRFDSATTMLTSTASEKIELEDSREDGLSSRMNELCKILDAHGLKRVTTSDKPSAGKSGLVEEERAKLEKLLDAKLPAVSRYEIKLVGSFPSLIKALHYLSEKLPTVSVLSVSLDPVDIRTRRHIWKLQVGIRG